MITINNGHVQINKSLKLTKRQQLKLSSLVESKRLDYLLSLMGRPSHVRFLKEKYNNDFILNKPTNHVINTLQRILSNASGVNHSPLARTPDSKWVGVEIECLVPGEDDDGDECSYCEGEGTVTCHNCEGNGNVTLEDSSGLTYEVICGNCGGNGRVDCVDCDGHSTGSSNSVRDKIRAELQKQKITLCSVRDDGSLNSGDGLVSVEVTVLFDASKGFDKLIRVCDILNKFKAEVDTSCGLHIHLDQEGKTEDEVTQLGNHLGQFLPILSKLTPKSRRKNRFCELKVSDINGCHDDRYCAVNLVSFRKHGTIEVRMHSGSTDSTKIINWIKLLHTVAKAKTPKTRVGSFKRFVDIINLDAELAAYYQARFNKFNDAEISHDNELSGVEAA